ncbi:MAG: hypothetical protein K2Q19_11540 [Rhodocyclaceae bacterium]|nr:hypothetical protein [Rhodocyclaceae bacterium]
MSLFNHIFEWRDSHDMKVSCPHPSKHQHLQGFKAIRFGGQITEKA